MTNYLIISSLLNFLAAFVLAFAVVLRGRNNRINVRFGVFAFTVGCWSAGYFLWQISPGATRALFFTRFLMLAAYFVPITFLHFVLHLCGEERKGWVRTGYAIAIGFGLLNFTPLMVQDVRPVLEFAQWPRAGRWFFTYLLFFVIYTGYAILHLLRSRRGATGGRAAQLRYILIATMVGFPGGATNFPLWYGVPIPPLGNALVFLYLVIMAHAVSRYHLPLVTYDFVQAAVYMGLSVTLAIFFLVGYTVCAPLVGMDLDSSTLLNGFLLATLVSLFYLWAVPRLKRGADRVLEQTYLRRRSGQHVRLKELSQRVITISSEQEMFSYAVREIAQTLDIAHAGILLRGEYDNAYSLRAGVAWDREGFTARSLPADSALVELLQQKLEPVLFDGTEGELDEPVLAQLEALRATMPFEAAFPIISDNSVLGALVLGPRGDRERYTENDLSLLESVCLQLAVNMRARQLERRSNQTEKLIALGTLAAGLAHEMRNPLVSIQTFSALLRERGSDPDFLQEFSNVVQRDVNRIASIVENVSTFAESNQVQLTEVQLADVLRTVAEIFGAELTRSHVQLILPTAPLLAIRGNYSQLLQVFLNLVQNAVQAMEDRPDSRIVVTAQPKSSGTALLCVSVTDNGPGIDPLLLPRIFDPFITTKDTGQRRGKHGMGLGLAIVKRIVQQHHGEIEVQSTLGAGTMFRIYLPLT